MSTFDRASQHRWTFPAEPLVKPGTGSCWLAIAGSALGFAALILFPRWLPGAAGTWLGVIGFVAIQLALSSSAIRTGWHPIFRRPRVRDIVIALVFVPFVVILPALVAFLVVGSAHLSDNSTIANMGTLPPMQVLNLFASSGIQLFGEELVSILPFLAILTMLSRAGLKPWVAVGLSWIVSALAFGALHLPTYEWHVGQALLVIGMARIVLTAVFLLTKNIWASTVAHIANDWSMLALSVFVAHSVH